MKKRNKGFTLIESLLVVGFLAATAVGIYAMYDRAASRNLANQDAILLETFKKDIIESYSSNGTFNGISNTILNQNSVTPIKMRDQADITKISNSFGGAVNVSSIPFGAVNDLGLRINSDQVFERACAILVTSIADHMDVITINGNVVKNYGDAGVDPATVTSACAAAPMANISFDVFPPGKIVASAAVAAPAVNPTVVVGNKGLRIPDRTADLVCGLNNRTPAGAQLTNPQTIADTAFYIGDQNIPKSVRDTIIFEYRNAKANNGRCIDKTTYGNVLNQVALAKAAEPTLTYDDIWKLRTGPIFQQQLSLFNEVMQTAAFDAVCQQTINFVYGAGYTGAYVKGSGDLCTVK